MNFKIIYANTFYKQLSGLDEKSKRILRQKIELIQQDPFRFKKIHSRLFNKVFRVRLGFEGKETRLVYVVKEPNVIIACLLERKNDYRDLEKYLSKI